jgi:hypothetical protein
LASRKSGMLHPLDNLFQEKPSHRSLSEEFGKTASATHLDILMVEHHPNNDLCEEVEFITPLISPSSSLEPKSCPSSHPNFVLDYGQNSMLILHDKSLRNRKTCAIDMLLSTSRSYKEHKHLSLLIYKLFGRMAVDAYVYHKYCKSRRCTMVLITLQLG